MANLVVFEGYESHDERRSGRDSWNDAAGDSFRLKAAQRFTDDIARIATNNDIYYFNSVLVVSMFALTCFVLVGGLDAVVGGAQVTRGSDELDVEVGIVVLLELDCLEPWQTAPQLLRPRQRLKDLRYTIADVLASAFGARKLRIVRLDANAGRRLKRRHRRLDLAEQTHQFCAEFGLILVRLRDARHRQTEHEGAHACGRLDEINVHRLARIEHEWLRQTLRRRPEQHSLRSHLHKAEARVLSILS